MVEFYGAVGGDALIPLWDATHMLPGAIYQYVYWRQFLTEAAQPEADERFVADILSTLDRVLSTEPAPN